MMRASICSDEDGGATVCLDWVQDGRRIAESPRWKLIAEEDHYTLLVYEVRPEDAGKYDCTVTNRLGRASCTARLNVVGMY